MAGQVVAERNAIRVAPVVSAPGFVGRERELAALATALANGPAVVLVEGEAGIGKTRLVQESLASPAGRQGKALVAWCPPFRQPLTLGPVVDALRRATTDVRGLRLSALAGALRPLFPEWAAGLPPLPDPLEDAAAARHRLYRALAELLDRLAITTLVVEDAHWADEATLEFLLFLAAGEPAALSVVVTSRPEDVPAQSLLPRLSRRAAGGSGRRLALEPLTVADTARLVSSMVGGEHVSDEFAAFLHDRTEGLPLALEESVRLMGERFDLAPRDGTWLRRRLADIGVPPTVRDAVLERAGRLSPDAVAVLRAAAVLAQPATVPLLAEVCGLPEPQAQAGLCEALAAGLLAEEVLRGQGLISFRHALAARAIYEATPAPPRREMHLRAGRALEQASPLPLTRLVRHFREAGSNAAWCRYAEQAADLALAAGDANAAAILLHGLVMDAALPAPTVVRLTRKIPLNVLRYALLDDLISSLRQAADDEILTPAQRTEVAYQLGRLLANEGEHEQAIAELERAVPGLGPAEAANAMVLLGRPHQGLCPASVHLRWLDRAAVAAQDASIRRGERMALANGRMTALLGLGEETGWAEAAELLRNLVTPQDTLLSVVTWQNSGDAAVRWGRYAEARQRLTTALRMADRHDYLRLRDGALVTLLRLDWFTGVWSGLADRAAALSGDDVDPEVRLEALLVTGLLEAAAGASDTAGRRLSLVLAENPRRFPASLVQDAAAALARVRLAEERIEEALALTGEPVGVIAAKGIWIWGTEILPVRVQALAAAGAITEAEELTSAFARGLDGRHAPASQAAILACQGGLAAATGHHRRAVGLFDRAGRAWDALPRPYDALLARHQQADSLLAAGATDEGIHLLGEVLPGLSRLGARGDARRVALTMRQHGAQTRNIWQGGTRGYGHELSPREQEVAHLAAMGRTNREIGQALCRSPKTVATQLSSAMRKLGVSSRTALAGAFPDAGADGENQR